MTTKEKDKIAGAFFFFCEGGSVMLKGTEGAQ